MKLAIATVLAVALAGCGIPALVKSTYNSAVDPGCDWISSKNLTQEEYQQLKEKFGKPASVSFHEDHRTETYRKGNTVVMVEVGNGQHEVVICKTGT